jgi:hypothetical protein
VTDDQAQQLRYLLDAALDPNTATDQRHNAIHLLICDLQALDRRLAGAPADGAEPDRTVEFERARRAALEVRPNETT